MEMHIEINGIVCVGDVTDAPTHELEQAMWFLLHRLKVDSVKLIRTSIAD
jgi:hypothetical protein